jgi:hypothetical protein
MDGKPLDAIMFKYVSPGIVASRIVGVPNIAFWQEKGWRVLIREDDVRYADWLQAMTEDERRWWKWS